MFDQSSNSSGRRTAAMLMTAMIVASQATDVFACSVCQGDPNSNLVKGAEAGVLFMVIVTYGLLLSMIGLGATWFVRQRRRLTRINDGSPIDEPSPSPGDPDD